MATFPCVTDRRVVFIGDVSHPLKATDFRAKVPIIEVIFVTCTLFGDGGRVFTSAGIDQIRLRRYAVLDHVATVIDEMFECVNVRTGRIFECDIRR